jgi:lysophospholipase L1-like esterase
MKTISLNALVVGDSWSSAVVAGEGDRMGWPMMLGIADDLRQAIAGSTAAQWADNFDGRLTRAAQTSADVVIISLLGNDAFAAIADGTVTPDEVSAGVSALRRTVETVRKARTIVLLYADPFCGRDIRSAIACPLLNAAICGALPDGVETFDTRSVLLPHHFDGRDIHPNRAGHEAIAAGLADMLTAQQSDMRQ